MMRKNQVFATGVQVKTRPEFLHRHHRAFDMPAGTPLADRCLPRGFARLRSLPEGEVAGAVLLVFVDVNARAVVHAGKVFFWKLSLLGEFGYAEIVITV